MDFDKVGCLNGLTNQDLAGKMLVVGYILQLLSEYSANRSSALIGPKGEPVVILNGEDISRLRENRPSSCNFFRPKPVFVLTTVEDQKSCFQLNLGVDCADVMVSPRILAMTSADVDAFLSGQMPRGIEWSAALVQCGQAV
jgi:hypothetical protein